MFNSSELSEAMSLFEDELSKKIFIDRLAYSISDDKRFLLRMIQDMMESDDVYLSSTNSTLIKHTVQWLEKGTHKKIALFGAADTYCVRTLLQLLYEYGVINKEWSEVFFVDNDVHKQGKVFDHHNPNMRLPIYAPEKLKADIDNTFVFITVATYNNYVNIRRQLQGYGFNEDSITGAIPCYEYNLGNIYFDKVMKPVKGDVFVDVGAYDMWNSEQFINWNPEYEHIYALEADPLSYEKCKAKLPDKTDLYPYGAWSENGRISFLSAPNGEYGGSRIDNKGGSSIETVALDNLLEGKKVSILKMDIEGSEIEALKGAQRIIREQKPCLTISAYHKKDDIVTLPLYIRSLNEDYRFFLRHHTYGIWDTVLYAIDKSRL